MQAYGDVTGWSKKINGKMDESSVNNSRWAQFLVDKPIGYSWITLS